MIKNKIHCAGLLIILALLGLLGNYLSLPLFFGVDFIFGSISVLIAVRLLGTNAAVITALITGSYTYYLWGHPYALAIFTAEAIIVSILIQRKVSSLVLADLIFWVIVGMPMVWIFYHNAMSMEQSQAALILFKQPVNGIANAIIATYLLMLLPKNWLASIKSSSEKYFELKEILFTTFLAFPFIITIILVVYQNNDSRSSYENYLNVELSQHADYLEHQIDSLVKNKSQTFNSNDYHRIKNKHELIFINKDSEVVNSTLTKEVTSKILTQGSHKSLKQGVTLWMPERNNTPFMLWWKQAYYLIENSVDSGDISKFYILQKSDTIINRLQQDILAAFILLFSLIIFVALFSYIISNSLTNTFFKLIAITKDLPDKLKEGSQIDWPVTDISEISQLTKHTQIMSEKLSEAFSDINAEAKAIIESSVDTIITIDDKGKIEGFNKAAEELFGYGRNEVAGINIKMLMPEPYRRDHDQYINNYQKGQRTNLSNTRREVTGQRKNATTFPMELTITEIKLHKKIIYVGIISDITERKATEKLKQEFISTVSHELRTPLTSIKGSINLIQGLKDKVDQEQLDSLLDVTSRNVDRLAILINDLLDFEKLDSSGVKYNLHEVIVAKLINTVVENDTPLAQSANINIVIDDTSAGEIYADLQRISQVLSNFISNAIKFSPAETDIHIGMEKSDGNVKIYVKDSGPGIEDEFQSKIFQRFSQADTSDNRTIQRGTGLGLAISKRFTEDMGGTIGFSSTLGEGSTFYIIYPLV